MKALLIHGPLTYLNPIKSMAINLQKPLMSSNFSGSGVLLKCRCFKNEEMEQYRPAKGFSVLESDGPYDSAGIWSTMAFYLFSLHTPLSFGGLAAVTKILHQPVLDLQTEAISVLILQNLELLGVLMLLRYPISWKPQFELSDIFKANKFSKERNWILGSAFGLGFLISLVFLTSIVADRLIGPKDVNNLILKEILSSGPISMTALIAVYCIVTPLLEEVVYRGFLLTSLSSSMKWQQAVMVSSLVFSAAHLSAENFVQLFVIGLILGCSYCWTGNLSTSLTIHSLYNAFILYVTYIS